MARIVLAIAVLLLAGCATNPVTGRSQFMLVTEQASIANATQAYSAMLGAAEKNGKISTDPDLRRRIDLITGRLIAQAVRYRPETRNWAWSVAIIDDPKTVNAFCMPGGKMAIYTGLVTQMEATDDEIAQVMGHEIGHALANHGAERQSVALASDLAVAIFAALASNSNQQNLRLQGGALAAAVAVKLPHSRGNESEADRIGIELAARAGYDPRAAATLWEKMAKASGGGKFDLLSTHPAPRTRMEELEALAPAMAEFYEAKGERPVFAFSGSTAPAAAGAAATPGAAAFAPASDSAPLMLHSAEYDRFRRGTVTLTCENACALTYGMAKGDLRKFHDASDWRRLAVKVVSLNYHSDVSWFYLGRAAQGLGFADSARVYFSRAVEAVEAHHCKGRFLDLCDGFELPAQARQALEALRPVDPSGAGAAAGDSRP